MAGRSGKETSDDHKYLSSRGCTSLEARVPGALGVADRRESERVAAGACPVSVPSGLRAGLCRSRGESECTVRTTVRMI